MERHQNDPLEVRQRRDCGSVEVREDRGAKAANRYSPLNNTFSSDDDEEESPLQHQKKLDSDSLTSIIQELTSTEKRNENKISDNAKSSISYSWEMAGAPILEVTKFVPEQDGEVGGLKQIQKLQQIVGVVRPKPIEEAKVEGAMGATLHQQYQ